MLMLVIALLAMPMVEQAEPAAPQAASQVMASATVAPETPEQAAERRRLDRLEVICSRRAPTGSRLDRTLCEPRHRAELEARAKQQETQDFINNTGMVKPLN